MKKRVYLAGAISGLNFNGAVDWRDWFCKELPSGIEGMSPMRGKSYLQHEKDIKDTYPTHALSSDRGITTRDFYDCQTCDLIVANLLGTTKVSIGTVMEIAWGKAFNKPVIVVMEDTGNLHDHAMIRESVGFRVNSLEQALWLTKVILLPAPHWDSNEAA